MNFAFYVSRGAGRLKKMIERPCAVMKSTRLILSEDASTAYLQAMIGGSARYVLIDYGKLEGDKNLRLSDRILEELRNYEIDYLFSFGRHILKGELLTEYRWRMINFHPSLLPMFRGSRAIDRAHGEHAFLMGCTAHFIDEGVDTGPVIMQCAMSAEVYRMEGYDGVLDSQIDMAEQIARLLEEGRIAVRHGEVSVAGGDYAQKVFFPAVR